MERAPLARGEATRAIRVSEGPARSAAEQVDRTLTQLSAATSTEVEQKEERQQLLNGPQRIGSLSVASVATRRHTQRHVFWLSAFPLLHRLSPCRRFARRHRTGRCRITLARREIQPRHPRPPAQLPPDKRGQPGRRGRTGRTGDDQGRGGRTCAAHVSSFYQLPNSRSTISCAAFQAGSALSSFRRPADVSRRGCFRASCDRAAPIQPLRSRPRSSANSWIGVGPLRARAGGPPSPRPRSSQCQQVPDE
jgi:hypothetical protein